MAGMSQARWDIMVKDKMIRIRKGTGFVDEVYRDRGLRSEYQCPGRRSLS
jgi:hypothetical protein